MKSPYEPENPYQVIRASERLACGVESRNGAIVLSLPRGVSREMALTVAGRLRARGYITQKQYNLAEWFREKYHRAYGETEPLSPERDKAMGKKKYYPEDPPGDFNAMKEIWRVDRHLKKRGRNLRVLLNYLDTDPVWLNGIKTRSHMRELGLLKRTLDALAAEVKI